MIRTGSWLAVLLVACCVAAFSAPRLLAEAEHVGGLTPFGLGRFAVKVYADGALRWYDQAADETLPRHEKKAHPFDGWRVTHLPPSEVQALQAAISHTPFTAIQWNRNAIRPSAGDGGDVTMRFQTPHGTVAVPLWQVASPAHLAAVECLTKIERRYAKR